MITVERSVTVDRPVEVVFGYLSDFETTTEWDPGTVRTTRVSGDGGPGTTYQNVSEFNGKQTELEYVVQQLTPNRLFQVRGENKTITAVDTMTFEGTDRTTVTYRAEFTLKGIARLAEPFLKKPFKKLGDEAETGLRDTLSKLQG
ncbi:SRPBCC family protein [Kribbella sp. NPDC051770]|uniref:SRPBCC family protein n=1 Tax=Kribbella sp. NPDC051770 TaxID=3155413 RepID=UPI00341E35CE